MGWHPHTEKGWLHVNENVLVVNYKNKTKKKTKKNKNQTFRQLQRGYGGLGKEWGRKGSSYAQEAVPQRWVESQWWEDGGPDPLDPAKGDNNSNNKLRQEENRRWKRKGESLERTASSCRGKKKNPVGHYESRITSYVGCKILDLIGAAEDCHFSWGLFYCTTLGMQSRKMKFF